MSIASIKAHADAIKTEVDALPPPGVPVPQGWPSPTNCLGGTVSTATGFDAWDYWLTKKVYHGRMQGDILPGSIAYVGSSIAEAMNVQRVHPACINYGIGGDTLRGNLNRIASLTSLTTAGAVIWEPAANDMGREPMDNIDVFLDRMLAWLTGPLVVVSPVPHHGAEPYPVSVACTNAVIEHIQARTVNRPNTVFVDITNPLRGSDGYMKVEYSIGDQQHPNAAGYAIMRPLIQSALATVL